jgi:hypothetical protein
MRPVLTRVAVDAYGALQVNPGPLSVDQMMNRASLELWRKHDAVFKRIYCHYATLDFLSADKVSWKGVRERNSTLSLDELTLQMINFAVNPGLLTKNQLRDILRAVDSENDADGALSLPRSTLVTRHSSLTARSAFQPRAFLLSLACFTGRRRPRERRVNPPPPPPKPPHARTTTPSISRSVS